MNQEYSGSCHCGAVQFTVLTNVASAVRCNCSMCERRSAIMLAGEEGSFKLIKGAGVLSKYQFGTEVAEHYFCSHCGIYTHHRPRSNPKIRRVNAGCLDGVDSTKLEHAWFDGAGV
ncbi:MAG: type I-B CRISPR-associated protein Cas8b1/Cst1 [Alteromonadaceae bacterium]|nr:MAG: type I-B CRISPR-associated protein Cas8b1/Cst1 [Alteromonadaceae bacterium]